MNQLFASYARGKEAKELAVILGDAALTEIDKKYVKLSDEFEEHFVKQGEDENRTIEESLTIGWKLLTIIPKEELKRIKDEFIEKYLPTDITTEDKDINAVKG
jgi:V/A-type H+-transporting ATPase subunit B